MKNKISEYVEQARKGEINIVEIAHKALEETQKINKEYRYINAFADVIEQAEELAKKIKQGKQTGKLFGVFVSVKDNLCVKGVESCAGSGILKGYKPLFDATAVEKCRQQGAIILGKTAQDEFGFGGFSVNIGKGFEKPLNPLDKKRSCGGSSGGAAGITKKATFPHLAIAESTGGSIADPASFCGVVGMTPTYGAVSRYGLIDYASSLDKIGTMALSVEDSALLLDVICGKDASDSTSFGLTKPVSQQPSAIQGLRIGVVKETVDENMDNSIRKSVLDSVYKLEQKGARKIEISLPTAMEYGISAYYILAMCEASTNLAKFCGLRYGASEQLSGTYNEYFSRVRSNNLGEEAVRRVLLGTFARMAGWRDAFYTKAAQVRTKIISEYQSVFKNVDVIITPTMPIIAPTFEEIKKLTPLQNYLMDALTVPPNLAGMPHISVPCGEHKGMPIGMMITAPHFFEHKLIQVAKAHEQ